MQKYFVIGFVSLACNLPLQSQVNYTRIDSLKKIIPGLKDSAKIDGLNALSKPFIIYNSDSAKIFALQALHEAQAIHYTNGAANAFKNLAWTTWFLENDYPGMEKYCKDGIALLEKTGSNTQSAEFYFLLGCSLQAQAEFSLAKSAYEKAGEIYFTLGDGLDLAGMYAYIAGVEFNRGHYETSLQYSVKWLNISKKYNNNRYLDVWADLYKNVGDYATASDYYRQAAQTARATGVIDELAYFTRQIGEIFFLQKQYDSAKYYYDLAIRYFPMNDTPLPFLGELYLALKEYDKAIHNLEFALDYYKRANGRIYVMWVSLRLSKAYNETGEHGPALQNAKEVLQIAQQTGARQYIRDAHFLLYQLMLQSGKKDSAFFHLQQYTLIRDTIDKDLSAQKLAFYKIKSEKEKDLYSINLLKEEKKLQHQKLRQTAQQKNFLIAGVCALLLMGGIIFRIVLLKRRSEKQRLVHMLELQNLESEKTKAELQRQAMELEMQALRAQMNPHFIFNSLNSINMFILENNKLQASEYLSKFSRLVRLILQNSQDAFIPLERELEALQLYLELESLRFDKKFEYKITVADSVDTTMLKVPPLIIQPYAENAIWHGLMHKKEKGHLEIELYQEEEILFCKITDDGIGRNKASELKSKSGLKHKSMGIKITEDRIAAIKMNATANPVEIKDLVYADGTAAGTEVVLKIPVITN
jgi:hypothetical protein